MTKPFTWIASAFFAVAALLHIVRLFTHFDVVLGAHTIPLWVSYVGVVVGALMSWMLCREARGTKGA